jgi:hypothetical protein
LIEQATFRKIKDLIFSFVISAIGVGALVGNAYVACNIGYRYHSIIQFISSSIMSISLVFAVLPAIPLIILSLFGIDLPFRGRESFIEMNMWLWVYCVFFYTLFTYSVMQYVRKRRDKTNESN